MNFFLRKNLLLWAVVMSFSVSCAPKSTLHVWRDENYTQKIGKTLIIFVTDIDYMRNHFENVLADRLGDSGLEALQGNRVMRQLGIRPEREAVVAEVRTLGIENIILARAVSKDEYARLVPGDGYSVPIGYDTGWNSFYAVSFSIVTDPLIVYDAKYFTVVANLYDVRSDMLVGSYLLRTGAETSRDEAVDLFIEMVLKELTRSKLL
jgi:hypothetical protein